MKKYLQIVYTCILVFACVNLNAQKYASPNGSSTNTGTINSPWDLQTALNSLTQGETLFLRGGIYNGRFFTGGQDGTSNYPITVTSYPGEWAVLNGNANCTPIEIDNLTTCGSVLMVIRDYYYFEDFEITAGIAREGQNVEDIIRNSANPNFEALSGIAHFGGINCKFFNLKIHDVFGPAIGSWNSTGATEIYGCLVYNNGFQLGDDRGSDNAFYIQNSTNQVRIIKNNILFNNFYKGIAVWSQGGINEFVGNRTQNVDIINNTSFNNASPAQGQTGKDNIFIGSNNDPPTNINISHNQLYHNTEQNSGGGSGSSLAIGRPLFYDDPHPDDIIINNNLIIGTNGLHFTNPQTIEFKKNLVFSRYIYVNDDNGAINAIPSTWSFQNNYYLTANNTPFRTNISPPSPPVEVDLSFSNWQGTYNLDNTLGFESTWENNSSFNYLLHKSVTQNKEKPSRFKVVIADFKHFIEDVSFLNYNTELANAPFYEVRDVENYNTVVNIGVLNNTGNIVNDNYTITFDLNLPDFEEPVGDYPGTAEKTNNFFGVFEVNFSECEFHINLEGTESSTITHQAASTITCSENNPPGYIIENNADVTLKAGQSIRLLPGFETEPNAKFHALIEHCETDVAYNGLEIDYQNESSNRKSNTILKEDVKEKIIKVHPNPASETLTIESSVTMINYELLDQLGTSLTNGTINYKTPNLFELNIDKLPSGMYFLKITLETGEIVTKQVIKK